LIYPQQSVQPSDNDSTARVSFLTAHNLSKEDKYE